MIEPKYLMLGDWVQVKNPSLGFYNVMGRIIAINEMEGHALSKTFDISFVDDEDHKIHYIGCPKYNVYPIPLTPEILEKNGFEYCEAHRMYLYLDDFFDIKIRQYSDMMWEFTYCNNEMNLPDTQIAGIGYVHHLQHALNMVGVEKDIII